MVSYGAIPSSKLLTKNSLTDNTFWPQIHGSKRVNNSLRYFSRTHSVSKGANYNLDQKIQATNRNPIICTVQSNGRYFFQQRDGKSIEIYQSQVRNFSVFVGSRCGYKSRELITPLFSVTEHRLNYNKRPKFRRNATNARVDSEITEGKNRVNKNKSSTDEWASAGVNTFLQERPLAETATASVPTDDLGTDYS